MNQADPWLSVIIPVWDPDEDLSHCLGALADLNDPGMEAILVHTGSRQRDLAESAAFARGTSLSLRTIAQPGISAGAARNAGASQARGEVLFFTSARCHLPAHLPARLKQLFADPSLSVAGGSIRPFNSDQPLAWLNALEMSDRQSAPKSEIEPCPQMTCAAFRAQAFKQAGMCDIAIDHEGDRDRGLCGSILAHGGIISHDPDLWVSQNLPGTWGQLWQAQIRRGENLFNELPGALRRGGEAYLQPILLLLALGLLLAMGPRDPARALSLALICILLMYPLNRAFLKRVGTEKPKLLKTAFLFCLLRPMAWVLGMLKAVLGKLGLAIK